MRFDGRNLFGYFSPTVEEDSDEFKQQGMIN